VDPALGAFGVLIEPASVVAKACLHSMYMLRRTNVPVETALITGAGPIGLLAALAARHAGLETHVVDIVDSGPKPDLVRDLGAIYHAGSAADIGISPDVVIECTGIGDVLRDAGRVAASGAIIALTGISAAPSSTDVDVNAFNKHMVLTNKVLFGSVNAARSHYEAAAKVLSDADPAWLGRVISRRVPLERWQDVLEVTNRCYMAEIYPEDDKLSPDGRVMEVLSEHQCQGWLEAYLLTGRHGFFSCYEAFIHIIDSMFNQHAKWLKTCNHIPWRRPIASFNYFLSSHVWRQDHNGLSHQDPGFIDHVVNKKAEVIRVYLPPDGNCLLSVTDHCLRSRNYVNVVVAGKQPAPQWLTMDQAIKHCSAGLGIWEWASNDKGAEPDVVMACCGDVPTLETLAAVELIRKHLPELKVRVVNVVDLMKLQPPKEHPHGLSDQDFDALFTKDKPVIFAYHGYPWLIHRLTYRRTNHNNLHVRGFKEEGTTTTPFDMVVLNDLDRFHLVEDVIDRLPQLGSRAAYFKQAIHEKLIEHREYVCQHGDDLPDISGWKWGAKEADKARGTSTEGDNV
jgi:hypothetical protein